MTKDKIKIALSNLNYEANLCLISGKSERLCFEVQSFYESMYAMLEDEDDE